MTIILQEQKPPRPFLLLKHNRDIREGDVIIFQDVESVTHEDGITVDKVSEQTVKVNFVSTSAGLYKGFQLIGWEDVV